PGTKLGIGPYITDGYYFDFDVAEPFTPEDLKAIQKRAAQIVKSGQTFNRVVVTEDEARQRMANEPFKRELVADKGQGSDGDSAVEVGAGGLPGYQSIDRKGEVLWQDLCRGPHQPNTNLIGNGFGISRSSAAYWRGAQSNASLQRVYGTA